MRLKQALLAQCNLAYNKPYVQLIEKLLPVMPHKSLDTFARFSPCFSFLRAKLTFYYLQFFWNSGAEAVEASVKLARHATGKQNIIVVQGSYHGRTFGTMAMTKSKTIYGAGYGPLMVRSLPSPLLLPTFFFLKLTLRHPA